MFSCKFYKLSQILKNIHLQILQNIHLKILKIFTLKYQKIFTCKFALEHFTCPSLQLLQIILQSKKYLKEEKRHGNDGNDGDRKPTSFFLSFKYFLDGTNDNKDILGRGYW